MEDAVEEIDIGKNAAIFQLFFLFTYWYYKRAYNLQCMHLLVLIHCANVQK